MKRYENRDKKSAIPFLKTNKKSPLNFNEIDINLLMSNPKIIHKLLDKDAKFTKKHKPCEEEVENDEDSEVEMVNPDGNSHLIGEYLNGNIANKLNKERPSKNRVMKDMAKRKWAEMRKYEEERPKGKGLKDLSQNPVVKKAGKLLRPIADFQF